jgi:hypothetical protein
MADADIPTNVGNDIDNFTDTQLKQLSPKDFEYLYNGKMDKMSTAGLEILSPTPVPSGTTAYRGTSMVARGLASPIIGATAGTALGAATFPPAIPILAGAGTLAVPAADLLTMGWNKLTPENYNIKYPSQVIQNLLTKSGVPTPQNTLERAIETGSSALGGTAGQVPALANVANTATSTFGRGLAETLSQSPVRQMAIAPVAGGVGQATQDITGNPYLSMMATLGTGALGGIGAKTSALTRDELAKQSTNLFEQAKNSGIVLNTKPFQANMKNIASTLRAEGYTPTGNFDSVTSALKELTTSTQPKDFVELQALRTMIKNGQASADANEKRVASILLDKFDNYVMNIPARDIQGGNTQQGMQAWQDARTAYSRLKKSEIFTDIQDRAEMNATRYTQSGAENALVGDLRNLANNKNKMRLFTADEQQEIRDAVKGGSIQNALRFMGKYAPTSPLAAAGGAVTGSVLGGTTGAGIGALAIPLIGTGARIAATKIRENQLNNLVDIMRLGGKLPTTVSPVKTLSLRGLLSSALSGFPNQQGNQ